MELLVHTISHADIVVEIARVYQDDTIESTLARPKFNQFHSLCGYIRRHVEALQSSSPGGHLAPSVTRVHARHMDDPHYAFSAICSRTEFPLGFRFSGTSLLLSELGHFSFRDSTLLAKWTAEQTSSLEKKKKDDLELENEIPLWCIQAVYFPLVGVLIPKWQSILQDHQSHHSSPLLYLLTGAGIPRDQREHAQGNSTEEIGILITLFMKHYYSTIAVQQVHSQDDLFRYDANVTFVTNQLQPHVEKQRQQLWNRVGSSWRRHFHVTLAYAGGTPARLSAVNAALRRYKPSYLHMWQLKTFWHAGKVSLDDVEFHSFDHIDASPALSIATVTNPHVHQVVTEMKAFRDQCLEALRQPHHELLSFWLRKTNQPVLSVLLVQNATDPTKVSLYRGMNCEGNKRYLVTTSFCISNVNVCSVNADWIFVC